MNKDKEKRRNLLIANVPTIICLLISAALVTSGTEGWGWFLFIALILAHSWGKDEE